MLSVILCSLGLHRYSLASIARREGQYIALCERCACPLVRSDSGKWEAAGPL